MNYGTSSHGTLSTLKLERLIEVGRSLTSNLDQESLLRQIGEAARELTGARYAALGVLNPEGSGLERFITVGIDSARAALIGDLPSGRGVLGVLIDNPAPLKLRNVSEHPQSYGFPDNHPPMKSFLGVPISIAGVAYGNLYLTDKNTGEFDDDDEASVITLATWAAIAIQNARSVREDRLRAAIDGAEQERRRWARELHDETLQSLGALNVLLSSAHRLGDPQKLADATALAIEQLSIEISNLRAMITELRPASLDEIGLEAALEGLTARLSSATDSKVELDLNGGSTRGFVKELEVTIYRIVQEATQNAIKHAKAPHIWVRMNRNDEEIEVLIRDDGDGFDPDQADTMGFGLVGMRERVVLAGGELEVLSAPKGGTTVRAALPLRKVDA